MKSYHMAVAVFATMTPISVFSIGVGNMTVSSSLNEPFKAEIPIFQLNGSLSSIQIGLASSENYEQIGLEHHNAMTAFAFDVKRNKRGLPILHISSQDRVVEPYFELLIRIVTPTVEFFRQYPVLLDPPNYHHKQHSIQAQCLKMQGKELIRIPQSSKKGPVSTIAKINLATRQQASIQNLYTTLGSKEQNYGPTLPEDTIMDIATHYGTSDLSINQIVLAIVGTNSKAFTQGNLNGLKTGEHLQIPPKEEISRVPANLAKKEIAAHDTAWKFKQEIQHVLLPPYIDGIRGISQFDTQQKEARASALAIQLNSPSGKIPNNLLALNDNPALTSNGQAQTDVTTNQALAEAYQASNLAGSNADQIQSQFKDLQIKNQKFETQIQSLTANLADMQKQLEILVKMNQSHTASSQSATVDNALSNRMRDFLMMIGAFVCGIFAFRLSRSKRKQETNKRMTPSSNFTVPEYRTSAVFSHNFNINNNNISSTIHDPIQSSSQTATVDPISQKDLAPTVRIPPVATLSAASNDSLIQFDFKEQANNVNMRMETAQPTPSTPVQSIPPTSRPISITPVQTAPVVPVVVPPTESNAPLIQFDLNQRNNVTTETVSSSPVDQAQASSSTSVNLTKSNSALNTLLDLARVYISMEDRESAKQALSEVIQFGDEQQKEKAQVMMDDLQHRRVQ